MPDALSLSGSLGAGLAWGWLIVLTVGRGRPRRRALNLLAALLASGLVASEFYLYLGARAPLYFLFAAVLAAWLHLAWREQLTRRTAPEPAPEG